VHGGSFVIDFGGTAPDHGQARRAGAFFEAPDVFHDAFGVVHFGAAGHDVGAMDLLDEVLVEDRLHRLDGRERLLKLFQQRHFQHTGFDRRLVGVVFEDVPAGDFEVLDLRQRHKVANRGAAPLGSLSQSDRAELSQGPDRLSQTAFDRFQTGDERRRYCAHAGHEHSQLALGGRNLDVVFLCQNGSPLVEML
jgi:hypothetical protein